MTPRTTSGRRTCTSRRTESSSTRPERTSNSLGGFKVDGATGKLSFVGSTPTEKQPRGFNIDPKGRFLVATGEKSETISVYAIDQGSGALKFLNKYPTGKGSNWVEMVSFD